MTSSRFAAGDLSSHRFFVVLFFLIFYVASARAFSLVDCKQANAEQGAAYCKEAFTHTYSENKVKFLTSPIKSGCCLTLSLRSCMEHAFTRARCDPKDQKVAIMIKDQISEAQKHIKHAADQFSAFICGDYKRENCDEHFLMPFTEAIHKINVLNASPALQASLLVTSLVTIIGSLYVFRWN